jgi:hypothetical protein
MTHPFETDSQYKFKRTGTVLSVTRRQKIKRSNENVDLLAGETKSPYDAVEQVLESYHTSSRDEDSPPNSQSEGLPVSGDLSFTSEADKALLARAGRTSREARRGRPPRIHTNATSASSESRATTLVADPDDPGTKDTWSPVPGDRVDAVVPDNSVDMPDMTFLDRLLTDRKAVDSPLPSPISDSSSITGSEASVETQSSFADSTRSLLRSFRRRKNTGLSSSEGSAAVSDGASSDDQAIPLDPPAPRQDLALAPADELALSWSDAKSALLKKVDALSFDGLDGKPLRDAKKALQKDIRDLYRKSFNSDLTGILKRAMKSNDPGHYLVVLDIVDGYLDRLRGVAAWKYEADVVWRDLGEVLAAIRQHCVNNTITPFPYSSPGAPAARPRSR